MVNILVIIQMESHYLKVCLKMVSNTESGPNFHEDGSLYWNLKYINGKTEDGIFKMFYPDGSLESEVTYGDGKPITNWIYYDRKGKKERVKIYEKGIFIYEKYLK